MNKVYIGTIFLVLIVGFAVYNFKGKLPEKTTDSTPGSIVIINTNPKSDLIIVDAPLSEEAVTSPFVISGKARGNWFFEASFPIELQDTEGNVLKTVVAQAQGDWMTTEFVPFEASLSFSKPRAPMSAVLVFKKDNPSGLPEHDNSIEVPVTIQ